MPCPTLHFCQQLFTRGVAIASTWETADIQEQADVDRLIIEVAELARLEAPGRAPQLDLAAAKWGLCVLAWGTLVLVDRANRQTDLPAELAATMPTSGQAANHWSIDLAFRHLAGIITRVDSAASDDPLGQTLKAIAANWPLACIGTKVRYLDQPGQVVMADESLRRLLLDRIIQRRDKLAASRAELQPHLPHYTNLLPDWAR